MYEIRCSININVFETGGDEAFNQLVGGSLMGISSRQELSRIFSAYDCWFSVT